MGVVASDSIQLASLKTVKDAATTALSQAASATSSAQSAQASAIAAGQSAARAQAAADAAQGDIDDMQEYFWHDALGAHVLSDTDSETHVTYRTDIKGDGLSINRLYNSETESSEFEVATFGANEARIGRKSRSSSVLMTPNYMNFYGPDGSITASIKHGSAEYSYVSADTIYQGTVNVGDEHTIRLKFKPGLPNDERLRINFYRPNGVLNAENQAIFNSYVTDTKDVRYHDYAVSGEYVTYRVTYDSDEYIVTISVIEMSEGAYNVACNAKAEYGSIFKAPKYSFGFDTTSSGVCSFAEGRTTEASGDYSHAEGNGTVASGESAHAEGSNTTASGQCSHASGCGTIASNDNQFVVGQYNSEMSNSIFIIGDGTDDETRSNVVSIDHGGFLRRAGVNVGVENKLTATSSQIGHQPEENKYTAFTLRDQDDSNTWFIQNVIFSNGDLRSDYMTTRLNASGTRLYNGFYQHIYADGTYGITFSNAATKAAWLAGLGAASETVNMGNPTIASGVGATVAANASCKTDRQVSVSLRLTGAKLAAGTADICTLPSGFRPAAEAFCVLLVNGVYRNGAVLTSGIVRVYSGVAVNGVEVKIMSTFRIA